MIVLKTEKGFGMRACLTIWKRCRRKGMKLQLAVQVGIGPDICIYLFLHIKLIPWNGLLILKRYWRK